MPRGARVEGFSRRHRFTTQGAFGAILRDSRKIRSPHAVLHVSPGRPGTSRFGIALTRRHFPSAVERNRLKRALREIFRRHSLKLAGVDVVISFRQKFDPADPAVIDELARLLDQASPGR